MFELSRGAGNVAAEVQRWQYFLRRSGFAQAGVIDGDFGLNTENATKFFQVKAGLSVTGAADAPTLQAAAGLGYTIVPKNYYQDRKGKAFPPEPDGLSSPSNKSRNQDFGCFSFFQHDRPPRPDAEAIVITSSCDGALKDWVEANIVQFAAPQLRFARGYPGYVRCHRLAAPVIKALLEAWEQADLLHLILSYEGCFVPRYICEKAPSQTQGHPARRSVDVATLSNHAFGSAFDINYTDNKRKVQPALCGQRGSVRELVEAANALGLYWGGHFGTQDGMHFEVSRLVPALVAASDMRVAPTLASAVSVAVVPPAVAAEGAAATFRPADPAIHWFKTTFRTEIEAALTGTPFSIDLIAAIAMQETSYLWRRLYKTWPIADVLAACAGDTLDAPNRRAFPQTRAQLEAEPKGDRMFALARAALEKVGTFDNTYKLVARNPNKFCHGFGIFQYDLQFFKVDPDYFLKEKWKSFDNSLDKCVKELTVKLVKVYGRNKTSLTHDESVYVAIAYNRGSANLKKDFKQGHKDKSGIFYGEYIDNYMKLSEKS